MHTIVLATQKGGSGKSTLAIGLALAAMQQGHAVRLIETDPQGTLSNWRRRRDNAQPVVETLAAADELAQRLATFERAGVTLTIIDTAGGLSALTDAALASADLCLIPVRPSVADVEATAATLAAIRGCDRPFAYVLNQTPCRGQRIAHAATALADEAALDAAGVLALPYIVMRNDHQDALGLGLAVSEYAPGGKSADEIRGLWQWIETRLGVEAPALTHDILIEFQPSPDITPASYQLDAAADEIVATAE
ncbi:chromosome partitioning protein [Rhodopseudomonas rhenobacensis]|uniref:Chromosome partitioning protein n=1 Tax=Rhodopseudomonas rhenobacensis TaxID=87461 RepID=A0A7W7Z559_9BRAD|nr:ParA family protein [Rhodopseudomonas rhenobacensis]MBB5048217.1 chromosome partitioning protein [Rhodopseudomonas rhenobacensis]